MPNLNLTLALSQFQPGQHNGFVVSTAATQQEGLGSESAGQLCTFWTACFVCLGFLQMLRFPLTVQTAICLPSWYPLILTITVAIPPEYDTSHGATNAQCSDLSASDLPLHVISLHLCRMLLTKTSSPMCWESLCVIVRVWVDHEKHEKTNSSEQAFINIIILPC